MTPNDLVNNLLEDNEDQQLKAFEMGFEQADTVVYALFMQGPGFEAGYGTRFPGMNNIGFLIHTGEEDEEGKPIFDFHFKGQGIAKSLNIESDKGDMFRRDGQMTDKPEEMNESEFQEVTHLTFDEVRASINGEDGHKISSSNSQH